jgi:hypothetical protein
MTTSTALVATTSLVTAVKILATIVTTLISDLASRTHPPKPYDIVRSGNGVRHRHDGGDPPDLRESPTLNAECIAPQDLPLRSETIQRRLRPSSDQVLPDPIWAAGIIWRHQARAPRSP